MELKNFSKFSLTKMQELVGQRVGLCENDSLDEDLHEDKPRKFKRSESNRSKNRQLKEEPHKEKEFLTINGVIENINEFGDKVGYIFSTDKYDGYFSYYPVSSLLGVDGWELPQEYMDDINQALIQKAQWEAENEKRIKQLVEIPVNQRIQCRYVDTNGGVLYRLYLSTRFSFDADGDVVVKIRHDGGELETAASRFYNSDHKPLAINMTKEDVDEFFEIYKKFDFYVPKPDDGQIWLDGWDLFYTFCDGETQCEERYKCPEKNDRAWILVEYIETLLKKLLPAEEFESWFEILNEYSRLEKWAVAAMWDTIKHYK
jgi:hypothetical protein